MIHFVVYDYLFVLFLFNSIIISRNKFLRSIFFISDNLFIFDSLYRLVQIPNNPHKKQYY